jgi:hypothetical protein
MSVREEYSHERFFAASASMPLDGPKTTLAFGVDNWQTVKATNELDLS